MAAVWQGSWNSDHVVLKSSIRSSASPGSAAVWLGFWNSNHAVLKLRIRILALPTSAAVLLGFWNSDHVVLNWVRVAQLCLAQQQSDWASGCLNMMKLGSGMDGRTGPIRTDRHECCNSYVDLLGITIAPCNSTTTPLKKKKHHSSYLYTDVPLLFSTGWYSILKNVVQNVLPHFFCMFLCYFWLMPNMFFVCLQRIWISTSLQRSS